ncbi:MAG: steroid 3-ketoacyl-CoA thiolase [Actinomycetota bacterium]|jgi:acetyl-CoA C-acetyltransferase|nr:acetyl-CoA C-acyltransferase [Acidimicrobiaceae bacterium]MCS5681514.1 steroid 3-ketoacyl-CoA thiolase [Acidimicrobiales bacterium]MEC7873608.1 steroid 3-ketoacyl-CoA thiolase [Actinomycetota bacterium]MEC8828553.1 steroid 3-ketoacyl-CoA thiolase [Actinomycetota bacterium]MEC8976981.1 steroid 3-ketoacyl-CoA thiolase [Actinomycetota bacterium]|tara:strand:+ start:144 stop:1310 length:1167 start_codon:yes stop_codon:yes gene_type:complete
MSDIVIVEAVRSPVGRRGGELSNIHPADLLSEVQTALIERSGVDPASIGQVVGGCVSQAGEQTANIARTAWLGAGMPLTVAATTVDAQCGSSQQAISLAYGLVASGVVDSAVGCGVESMTRNPMGSSYKKGQLTATPRYKENYEYTTQFQGAELLAKKWNITRDECDEFGLRSQENAARAWEEDRFATQIVEVEVPVIDEDGTPTGERHRVTRDGGMRPTTREGLAQLSPVMEGGVHTAGASSQISDGSGAVLLMTADKANEQALQPIARVVDTCLVGSDPVLMLTGPIEATHHLLERNKMTMADIDVVEINEAFASVVLAWAREMSPDMDTVNPNGGAIALGHPLGGTGSILMTKAVHELHRTDKEFGLVTMCCGGGLGTGTIIQRL